MNLTKLEKDWLIKEVYQVFSEEDFDGTVSSVLVEEHKEDSIVIRIASRDRFGNDIAYVYINGEGEVGGDLVDSFNDALEKRIK